MIIKSIPARLDTSVGHILSISFYMKERYDAIFRTYTSWEENSCTY
jgi:hypothetical protein